MEIIQTNPEGSQKKKRASKTLRNALVSVCVLIVLFVAVGVIYTFLLGGAAAKQPDKTKPVSAAAPSEIKPTPPAANAKLGVAIGSIMSPVPAGANTSLTARTLAGANCAISVIYSGAASQDSGLSPKTADAYGTASWTWTVGATVPAGTWPVKVSCTFRGQSAVVDTSLQVTH